MRRVLLTCLLAASCSRTPAPARPVDAGPPAAAPVPTAAPNTDLPAEAYGLLGSWELDPVATAYVNRRASAADQRRLQRDVLPGVAGLVVTYREDGKMLTRSRTYEEESRWRVERVEGSTLELAVTHADKSRRPQSVVLGGDGTLETRVDGVTVVLRRAAYDRPRPAALPVRPGVDDQEDRGPSAAANLRGSRPGPTAGPSSTPAAPPRSSPRAPDARCEAERSACLAGCGVRDTPCINRCWSSSHCPAHPAPLYVE